MAVNVPQDRRFRRSGPRAVRRRPRLRSRWWWQLLRATVVLGTLAAGAVHGARYLVDAPMLRVRTITIEGTRRISPGEIAALLDGLKGERMLRVDLARWRDRLLASSWVADAELRRRLPSTVDVRLVEREPVGIARFEHQLFLIDASGTVIDEFGPRYADVDLPVVDGLLVADPQGSHVDREKGQLVADMMADVGRRPDLARRVSQIDISNPHDVRVILDGDPAVIRLGDSRFLERIWSYVELQGALRERVPAIDYVDLRFDDRVYVGPAAAVAAAASTARPAAPAGQPETGAAPAQGRDGRQQEE